MSVSITFESITNYLVDYRSYPHYQPLPLPTFTIVVMVSRQQF